MITFEGDARFSAALEDCCRRVQRGEVLERCLNDYSVEYRGELSRLVPLTARFQAVGDDPSPEFQRRLEQRLLDALDQDRARGHRAPPRLGPPLAFLRSAPAMRFAALGLAAMLVVAMSGAGAVQASEDSMPDSPLYQVKAARDWVRLALARDGESRVGVHADQIGQRGRELQFAVLADKPRPVVQELAVRLAFSVERIVDQALELHERGRLAPAARSLMSLREMGRQLDRLAQQAAAEARPSLQRLQAFLDEQEQRLLERGVPNGQRVQPRGK